MLLRHDFVVHPFNNRQLTSYLLAVCQRVNELRPRLPGGRTLILYASSSLKAIQAISEGSDLSAVLAFVSVVHVDQHIIQGIVHAIPGERSALAKRFGGKRDDQ